MKYLRVLAFGPFDGRNLNLSYESSKIFNGMILNDVSIDVSETPVVWRKAKEAVSSVAGEKKYDFILGLGEGRKDIFSFEMKPKNASKERQDVEGFHPPTREIFPGEQSFYEVTTGQEEYQLLKDRGWPVEISEDAGEYLCEEMAYSIARYQQKHSYQGYFVHVPSSHSAFEKSPLLSSTDISAAILLILLSITKKINTTE